LRVLDIIACVFFIKQAASETVKLNYNDVLQWYI